ncbi:MAG: zinc-dependent metalloprotease [Burkholderiales bacterium]|nr:zinc-dependent metalloprotease [Burkholderiales bacterium]
MKIQRSVAALLAAIPLALAAQGEPNADAPAAAPAAAPPASAASRPQGEPAPLRAFNDVVKDAKRMEGFVPLWQKDERVWLEVPKELLGKPFLFSVNIASSVGERGLYASQMAGSQMVEFRRIGRQMQLIALNTQFRAVADQGSKRAIEQAFSPSLVGSAAVVSAEHPTRKSVLVDASFLFSDIPAYSTRLERAYRLPFSVDRANSSFERVRAEERLSTLTARIHFATPRIPAPPLTPPAVKPPTPPQATPDPRSLFVDYVYSFLALPDTPMRPRAGDPRVGNFTESFTDLGGDMKANPRTHYVMRWRLEKKDPAAAVSEPVKPVVFWLDKNIPVKYRPAVAAGVLEWNKAFEKIGIRDALVVRQQPDDADWDNMDAGHASVRWFVGADVGFAIGPSDADPRTGEILDADIGMSDVFARGSRRFVVEDIGASSHDKLAQLTAPWRNGNDRSRFLCEDMTYAAMDMHFAMDLLEARGEIDADSPEAEAFVTDAIKGIMMHEVGHVLGLKHNFKGSTVLTGAQLQDRAYLDANGLGNSVMDYTPFNLAVKGEKQGSYHRTTIGAYDYWAIEYAYRPLDPAKEKQELAKIAARSTEPGLAFGDDTDAGRGVDGMDPMANLFDLGDDPIAYYRKRLKLSQELWARLQERKPREGEDPLRQRRSLMAGFGPLGASASLAAKYVGGMHAVRDLPGTSNRPAFRPVEPAKQREALQFLASGIFSADSFRFKPELLASLSVDYQEWERQGPADITTAVARVQLPALDRLMNPSTASRLLDLPSYVPASERKGIISLNEVYETVQRAVWSELASGGEIDRLRRNLQREHLKRLSALLTKGSAAMPADALSLVRYNATRLEQQLRAAVARPGNRSVESRAHLEESLGILKESLRATMQRG